MKTKLTDEEKIKFTTLKIHSEFININNNNRNNNNGKNEINNINIIINWSIINHHINTKQKRN